MYSSFIIGLASPIICRCIVVHFSPNDDKRMMRKKEERKKQKKRMKKRKTEKGGKERENNKIKEDLRFERC